MKRMSTDNPNFSGLRVASLESRNAEEMSRMIARFGGVCCCHYLRFARADISAEMP